jgi:predicted RNA binding protein YcfA (HicA-like mRNA interferase family)
MTPKELKRKLTANGWVITQGSGYEMAKHPCRPGVKIPVPRHTGDVPTGTLNNVLKAAGLK